MFKETLQVIKDSFFDYYSLLKKIIINNYDKLIEILIFYIILTILYFSIKLLISKLLKLTVKIRIGNHKEVNKERIDTLFSVFKSILKVLFIFILFLFILKEFNIKLGPILASAGVLGAAFVVSFQSIIQDIIRGWILIFEDQARKGEWVTINNTFTGKVVEFNLRGMVLLDRERNYIFLPNSQINIISNLSREDKKFFIGIRFNKDIDLNKKFEEIEKFIKLHKDRYKKIYDLKIEEKFNITPDYYEIFISFKTKFSLGEHYLGKIKIDLIKEFKDYLREIV